MDARRRPFARLGPGVTLSITRIPTPVLVAFLVVLAAILFVPSRRESTQDGAADDGPDSGSATLTATSTTTRTRLPLGWLTLAFTVLTLVLFAPGVSDVIFNPDEAFVATQARMLEDGGTLYVDVVDRKPPIVPVLYRVAGAFTDDLRAMRVLAVVARVATALLLAWEANRRWGGRCAWWAGLGFLFSAAALPAIDTQAANFEVFMAPTMVAALILGARGRPGGAGVALALSTLTKQTAAAGLLPLAYLAWRGRRGRGLGLLVVGFVVPIVVTALVFGARDFLFWNYFGTGDYLDVSGFVDYAFRRGLAQTMHFVAVNLVLLAMAAKAWRTWRRDLDLWLWFVASLAGVAAGLRFFDHYFLQLIPVLCLLAARPFDELSPRRALAGGMIVVVTAGFSLSEAWGEARSTDERLVAVTEFVREHTAPDDSILVWGHWAELYYEADRPPASRFLTTGFLTGHSGGRPPERVGEEYATAGAWEDFEAELAADPPDIIVIPREFRSAAYYRPADFPRFGDWLTEHYELVAVVEDVEIWMPVTG